MPDRTLAFCEIYKHGELFKAQERSHPKEIFSAEIQLVPKGIGVYFQQGR